MNFIYVNFAIILFLFTLPLSAVSSVEVCSWYFLPKKQRLLKPTIMQTEDLLELARLANVEKIKLPYKMTSSYESSFVKVETMIEDVDAIYFSYLPPLRNDLPQQIIPTYQMVDSWHNLIRNVDGHKFHLAFKSAEARSTFLKRINQSTTLEVGVRTTQQGEEFLVMLSPEQYENILRITQKSGVQNVAASSNKYVQVSKMELESASDFHSSTFSSTTTTYYFKQGSPIGYSKNGKYFKLKQNPNDYINYADHLNILRRQRRGEVSLSPQEQFQLGRKNIEEAFKAAKINSLPEKNYSIFKHFLQEDGIVKQHQLLQKLSQERISVIQKTFQENASLPLAKQLSKIKATPLSLKQGPKNGDYIIRFVTGNVDEVRDTFFIFSASDLLHDQMSFAGLGSIAKDAEFATNHIRGGLMKFSYDEMGLLKKVKVIDDTIRLPSGIQKLTTTQVSKLENSLAKTLNPKLTEIPLVEKIDLHNLKDAKISFKDKKGYAETMNLIMSKEHLIKETTFKRAFNIFEVEETGQRFIVTTNWRNPERDSSHYSIWLGLNSATDQVGNARFYPNVDGLKWLSKGYLRPAAEKGVIEIYDLSGSMIWSSGKLSNSALETQQLFYEVTGYKIPFAPDTPEPQRIFGRL